MDSCDAVKRDLSESIDAQLPAVAAWHAAEPAGIQLGAGGDAGQILRDLVLAQHLCNFRLWHVEDVARRKDVDASVIARCKQEIDALNQKRTDAFETVDEHLVRRLGPLVPSVRPGETVRRNTESLGMVVDRLSILALKIYHMAEQTRRDDADADHRKTCAEKLAVLEEQRVDLAGALLELVDDFCTGAKRPKAYYQFKMYNDPSLNPQLYGKR